MVNKKLSKIIGPVAGAMLFIMSVGVMPVKVYAAETQSIENEAAMAGSENMNYEIEQNGVKLKVTNIVGTKNKIKMNASITREDGFEEDIFSHRNIEFEIYMDKAETSGSGSTWSYPDDKTIEITAEEESEKGFAEKGNVRFDLIIGDYDFNGSLVIPVDFTESFKQYMKKDLDVTLDKSDTIIGFESDAIGTRVIVSRVMDDTRYWGNNYEMDPRFIIKAGDKIYTASSMGSSGYSSDDEYYQCYFEAEELTYNDIKDVENISVIPLKCTLTSDEMENQYKDSSYYEKLLQEKVVSDNIKYNKEFTFTDKTKADIKVERAADKINIYCTSDSDMKSLILAQGVFGIFTDGTDDYTNSIFEEDKTIFKAKDAENQYVVQFADSHPDMLYEINIDRSSLNIDKFDIGDEIKIK